MAEFRFRLATLLRLREAARDERRGRLAEAYAADQKLVARSDELENEVYRLKRQLNGPGGVGQVNVDQLLSADRYEVLLKAEVQVLAGQRAQLGEEIERRRLALVEADREVRLLEKYREKLHERHRAQELTQSIKRLDEVASRRHWEDDA